MKRTAIRIFASLALVSALSAPAFAQTLRYGGAQQPNIGVRVDGVIDASGNPNPAIVPATISLAPDGSASQFVQGNTAAGTADTGNPVKMGCYAMSTAPTAVANGQREDVWCGTRGQQLFALTDMTGNLSSLAANNAAIASTASAVFLRVLAQNYCWDGAQWVQASNCPSSAAAAGSAAVTGVSSTGIVLKASAGNVYDLTAVAPASAGFVQLLNLTAVPADATTNTPIWCMPLAANAGLDKTFSTPRVASTGAVLLFSSTACGASLTKVAAPYLAGAAK